MSTFQPETNCKYDSLDTDSYKQATPSIFFLFLRLGYKVMNLHLRQKDPPLLTLESSGTARIGDDFIFKQMLTSPRRWGLLIL